MPLPLITVSASENKGRRTGGGRSGEGAGTKGADNYNAATVMSHRSGGGLGRPFPPTPIGFAGFADRGMAGTWKRERGEKKKAVPGEFLRGRKRRNGRENGGKRV